MTIALIFATPGIASSNPPGDPFVAAASIITCPAAPTGFYLPAGEAGRFVLSPLSTMNESPGGTSVQVSCKYFTKKTGDLVTVAVRYALPTNYNPYADFAIGCTTKAGTTGSVDWNSHDRIFRVASSTSWSFADFSDEYDVLKPSQVAPFEVISRSMLASAQPVAHNCQLAPAHSAPQTVWTFGFDANVTKNGLTTTGSASGSFVTKQTGQYVELGNLQAGNIVLTMSRGSAQIGSVTLKVTQLVSFTNAKGDLLSAVIRVAASSYAPCAKGATGTLTVATNTRLAKLQVCNGNLLQGAGKTNAHISS